MTAAVNKLLCHALAMIALVFGDNARAADSLTAPWATRDATAPHESPAETARSGWTGFYVGAHAGVSGGHSAWSATQPGGAPNLSGSLNFFRPFDVFDESGSHFAGFTAGYNYQLRSGVVLGIEADASLPSTFRASQNF